MTAAASAAARPGTGGAIAMMVGSCASVQVGAALAARLFPAVGSTGATLLRLVAAGGILLLLVRPRTRAWDRRQWAAAALLGLSLAAMNGCFYAALARIPLGTAVTIEFLGPLSLAAVLSRRLRDLGWVLLALVGVVLLWGARGDGGRLDPAGVGFALVAAVFWAAYILAGARVGAVVPGLGGLAVATAIGAVALVPFGVGAAGPAVTRPDLLLIVLGTGLLASVIPYSLEISALRRLPPRVFGVLLSLEPAVAALVGWLLLGQAVGAAAGIAIGLVIVASIGSTATARQPAAPTPVIPAEDPAEGDDSRKQWRSAAPAR